MDDIERRLRAAMLGATEQPPSWLMEGIRRRHRQHLRRVGVGCVAMAAAIGLAVPAAVHGLRPRTHQAIRVPAGRGASPAPSTVAAPGTMLLTCDAANWGQLPSNWRSASLRVGPLWFVNGRQFGYVHRDVGGGRAVHRGSGRGMPRLGVMIIEVADGSTVVMKAAPGTRSYFRLLQGFDASRGIKLARGDSGFTFVSCPKGSPGFNGAMTDFYLGFQIQAGSSAPVNVWTSPTARPIRVIFTCPGRGCEG
jgi:hypothetical protein